MVVAATRPGRYAGEVTRRRIVFALGAWVLASTAACSGDEPVEGTGGGGGSTTASTGIATSSASSASTGAAAGGGGGGAPAGGELSIITWNIEQFPKSPDTVEVVAAAIEELAPDLVALQELPDVGEGNELEALDEALAGYAAVVADEGDTYRRVGLLHRTDRIAVDGVTTLFKSDDWAFPRPMLTATAHLVDEPGRSAVVGVVHLKASLDDDSTARRREACIAIDDWIRTRQAAGVAAPFVIVGDYNDELTDPEEWNVFGPLLDQGDGGFLTLAPEQAGDHTYLPFDSFIDHVLVRGGDAFATGSAEVLHLEDTIAGYVTKVSDHIPVRATIRLPAP